MQWTSAPNIAGAPLPQRARGYWGARFRAVHEGLERLLEAERTQLPPWLAVGFGAGIAAWFVLERAQQWAAFLCIVSALALEEALRPLAHGSQTRLPKAPSMLWKERTRYVRGARPLHCSKERRGKRA